MNRDYRRVVATLTLTLLPCISFACLSRAQSELNTNASANKLADRFEEVHKGAYENATFFYRVLIPIGLKGLSSPPPMPQHGIVIPLSDDKSSSLSVQGYYNSLLWTSLDAAFDFELKETQKSDPNATVVVRQGATLENSPAIHFVIKYVDKESKQIKMLETTIAFRRRPGEEAEIVYEVNLETTETRFTKDTKVYDEVIRSWKML